MSDRSPRSSRKSRFRVRSDARVQTTREKCETQETVGLGLYTNEYLELTLGFIGRQLRERWEATREEEQASDGPEGRQG